jgi:hypothetical protein
MCRYVNDDICMYNLWAIFICARRLSMTNLVVLRMEGRAFFQNEILNVERHVLSVINVIA